MDEKLVIPKDKRDHMLSAIHFGHAGRESGPGKGKQLDRRRRRGKEKQQ